MTEQAQEQAQGQAAPENGDVQPEAQPETEPFFVARTQEDFNKKAGITREGLRNTVTNELLEKAQPYGVQSLDDVLSKLEALHLVEQETQTEAERLQKELETLSPKAEKAERYEGALKTYLDKEREGLPEHIITLLDKMDAVEQLGYINEHREALKPQGPGSADVGKPFNYGDEPASENPFSDEHFNLTKQGEILRRDPARAEKLKQAAGKA